MKLVKTFGKVVLFSTSLSTMCFPMFAMAAVNCPAVANLVIKSTTQQLTVKVSDIPGGGRYADYNLQTYMEDREGLFSEAYAAAITKCCGAAALGAGVPAVVKVIYTNGASESFFHGLVDSSVGNYAIPGTQTGPNGAGFCKAQENTEPPPNSTPVGGGGAAPNGGFAGMTLPPGGMCIDTESDVGGVHMSDYSCYE
jgi:hypothetical protein